ncbi:MAG: signal recognition particle-docking protein FtsY [Actinobacteria bacterium]|nr:signal recognition particle-docking protein FtsY [Actinomycetota bacterium]
MNFDSSLVISLAVAIALVIAISVFVVTRKSGDKTQISKAQAQQKATDVPSPDNQQPETESDVSTIQASASEIPGTVDSKPVPIDVPESMEGRKLKLRERLGRSQGSLGQVFKQTFSGSTISDDAWQDLEDTLIMADLGVSAATGIVETLKTAVKKSGASSATELHDIAKSELIKLVDGGYDRTLHIDRHTDRPAVVLTVGVNGTGKTTTTGKLARMLSAQDKDVLLGAADTFRAAAAEQLTTWGDRVGVPVIRGAEGSDPASVAFESVNAGLEQEVDVVLIDTAGRLHTKQGLMDELGKLYRVAGKLGPIDEVLLVIDATTGQNGLTQAKVFSEVVPVTGVVLSKLDGTAKGGIIVAIQETLGVPVKLVGLGEGPDDLAPFDAEDFVSGLLS